MIIHWISADVDHANMHKYRCTLHTDEYKIAHRIGYSATGHIDQALVFFSVITLRSTIYRLPVQSSLMTSTSALQNSCQLRPDIALTDPEQLTNLSQLSRRSFMASVLGCIEAFGLTFRMGKLSSQAQKQSRSICNGIANQKGLARITDVAGHKLSSRCNCMYNGRK